MNDHVLLNISTITGKWFRKFVFNFNLTSLVLLNDCQNHYCFDSDNNDKS